jgi:hypothetical protein
MKNLVGNCQTIDWQAIVDRLKNTEPMYKGPRHMGDNAIPGVIEIAQMMEEAGYKTVADGGNMGWDMFAVTADISDEFEKFVGAKKLSCWISSVHPGHVAPWHWDTQDDEEAFTKIEESVVRFHVHMEDTKPGHILIVEDEIYYNAKQGDVYQWPERVSWHAGSNCGVERKFIFNFFGTKI